MKISKITGPKLSLFLAGNKINQCHNHFEVLGRNFEKSQKIFENALQNANIDYDVARQKKIESIYTSDTDIKKFNFGALIQIGKLQKVKHFIEKLTLNSYNRRYKGMTMFHYNLLNDLTNFEELKDKMVYSKNDLLDNLKIHFNYYYNWVNRNFPIFESDSKCWLFWDSIILLLLFFFIFIFSLELTFDIDFEEEFQFVNVLKIISCLFFSFNIFFKMNTEYFEYGICVKERDKIMINYAKNMFFWDLIALVALTMSFYSKNTLDSYKIMFFFTYFNIRKLYNNIKGQNITNEFFEICLLLFRLVCFSHFIACIWHAISYFNIITSPNHWVDEYRSFDWQYRYIASLYWAITTLCTVGYGDITPNNFLEMGYCCFVMLMGTLIFGYSINSIGILINRIEERGKDLVLNMTIIDNFMNKGNIKEDLKIKVKNYLQYIWKSDDKNLEKAEDIIKTLPTNLRKEILIESVGKLIQNISILKKNFSKEFLNEISLDVKPFRYSPCDKIYNKGDFDIHSLFIIKEGQIDLVVKDLKNKGTTTLKILKSGDFFGELPFFTKCSCEETAISHSFAIVYKISKNDFLEKLKDYPDDYEKFMSIKDKILLNHNYKNLFSNCPSCNKPEHRIEDCPFISCFTSLNRYMILQKHLYSKEQIRSPFKRKNERNHHFNSRMEQKKIMIYAKNTRRNKILMEYHENDIFNINPKLTRSIKFQSTLYGFDDDSKNSLPSITENIIPASPEYEEQTHSSKTLSKIKSLDEDLKDSTASPTKVDSQKINNAANSSLKLINIETATHNNKFEDALKDKNSESFSETKSSICKFLIKTERNKKSVFSRNSYVTLNDNVQNSDYLALNFEVMKEFRSYNKNGNVNEILKKLENQKIQIRKKKKKIRVF